MPGFDLRAVRRWARFDPGRALVRRDDDELRFAAEEDLAGRPLLLDTCVYIHQMQARAPELVERLVRTRIVNHSTVAVQELAHSVGALDPDDPRTAAAVKAIELQIGTMPEHRLFVPGAQVLGRAALLAGMLARLQDYAKDARLKALQDCVLFLQAQRLGCTILTANIREFDLLLQLIPEGQILFYRAST